MAEINSMADLEGQMREAYMHSGYIAVEVHLPGQTQPEVIINSSWEALKKLEYYKQAYTDDLKLKANHGIVITDFATAQTWSQLFDKLYPNGRIAINGK